ncbi:MAG: hypothetical protein V8R75_01495 [Oscillospiraceae bacterium]
MSVKENLLMGALNIRNKNKVKQLMDKVIGLFPRLGERLNQQAGLMSGGERKMFGDCQRPDVGAEADAGG